MRIATNVSRDAFGGITISNLALFDWLADKEDSIIGVEFLIARRALGAVIFRRYDPSFFRHHIVNALDVVRAHPWHKEWSPASLRKHWATLVESTKDILREERPDVVLVNGTYYASWILSRAAHELNLPVVVRYAGVLKREVGNLGILPRRRLLAYEREIASQAHIAVFPSEICRTVVETEVLGESKKDGVVIPNPAERGVPVPKRRKAATFTIAAVGRWTTVKNFPAFVALHKELRRTRWKHEAILVTTTIDRAREEVPRTIQTRPAMDTPQLRAFYRSVDLIVVPSHFETFSNVAAEALLLGTPVLVSESVGFADILKAAGLKRMVIPTFDDPQAAAAAVRRLAKTKLTAKERAAVAALIDPARVHDRLLRVLRSAHANH